MVAGGPATIFTKPLATDDDETVVRPHPTSGWMEQMARNRTKSFGGFLAKRRLCINEECIPLGEIGLRHAIQEHLAHYRTRGWVVPSSIRPD